MKINKLSTLIAALMMLNASLALGLTAYDSTVLSDGAYAYWPLQETSGSVINDVAGTNSGTLMTSTDLPTTKDYHVSFIPAGAGSSDGISYNMGGPGLLPGFPNETAVYFTNLDGQLTNAQIVVPYNAQMDPASNFTMEAWVHLPTYPIGYTNGNEQVILGLEANSGSQAGWWIDTHVDGSGSAGIVDVNLAHGNHAGWTSSGPTPEAFTNNVAGADSYMVITYSASSFKFYENGVLIYAANNPTYAGIFALPTHIEPFIIGSYCESYFGGAGNTGNTRDLFFNGAVSHVAYYTNVLTPTQILNHYLTGVSGANVSAPFPSAPPVGGTNYIGYSRTFSITAGGTQPLSYQWYNGASPIHGATNNTLTLNDLQLTNSGSYSVTVTNILGSTNIGPVTLLVQALPLDVYQSNVISALPVAFYPLHETNGPVCYDLIDPVDNNGTYVTYDATNAPVLFQQPGASSYLGTAVTLDSAATNGIYINNPTAMGIVGPLTIEAWVQLQDISDQQYIVTHGPAIDANPNKSDDALEIDPYGEYSFERDVQVAIPPTFGPYYAVPPEDQGQWVYLVGVADGTYWRLYRNGVDIADMLDTNMPPGAVTANGGWAIGARPANGPAGVIPPSLDGSINNVAIYDYALTPAQIQQHYQIGLTGTNASPPLVSIQLSGPNVIITWNSGYLQEATSINGPWTYANTATSPYAVPANGPAAFYRTTLTPP